MGGFTNRFSQKISANDKQYKRNLYQTYLTGPEWRNVEMSEEYAAFLQQNKPFYRFPFFTQIMVFWSVFFNSYAAARKEHGHFQLIFSEYMLMNLFIGINSTLEFASKGIVSLLLWPFLPKENNTEFQGHVAQLFTNYAQFIHHTPFYNFSYFSNLGPLFSNFWHSKNKSFADVISLVGVTVDFIAHGIISAPVGFWYNHEDNKVPETIDVLVKQSTDEDISEQEFAEQLRSKLSEIPAVALVAEGDEPAILTRHSEKNRTYAYSHLRIPRYEFFQDTVLKLTAAGINVREIAGQQQIQIKCVVKGDNAAQVEERGNALSLVEGCTKLYTYQNGVDNGQTFFSLNVSTQCLNKTIESIEAMDGVSIKLMHDF